MPKKIAVDLNSPGGKLRMLRLARGMTQETLGKQVHVSQSAVAQWERNMWLPAYPTQLAIADALGTNRTFLFGEAVA